jgi:VanZ family protein
MPRLNTREVTAWLPPLVWMTAIFFASTDVMSAEHTSRFIVPFLRWALPKLSQHGIEQLHFAIRKLAHLTEYAVLALLIWRALRASVASNSGRAVIVICICATYAALDEFHQSFVGTRGPSVQDVMIDTAGALAAVVCCWLLSRRRTVNR